MSKDLDRHTATQMKNYEGMYRFDLHSIPLSKVMTTQFTNMVKKSSKTSFVPLNKWLLSLEQFIKARKCQKKKLNQY